jgi:hypothetical protein
MTNHRQLGTLLLVGGLLARSPAGANTSPAEQCAAAERTLAGKLLKALTACDATAVAKGVAVDATCVAKAQTAFATAWGKVEARGGCATTSDATSIANAVEAFRGTLDTGLMVTGPTPSTCSALKTKAAGQDGACQLVCEAKAVRTSHPPEPCLPTCTSKLSATFGRAELEKTGACRTTGDAVFVATLVDGFVGGITGNTPPAACGNFLTTWAAWGAGPGSSAYFPAASPSMGAENVFVTDGFPQGGGNISAVAAPPNPRRFRTGELGFSARLSE